MISQSNIQEASYKLSKVLTGFQASERPPSRCDGGILVADTYVNSLAHL